MRHAERFSPAGVHYTSIYNMKNKKRTQISNVRRKVKQMVAYNFEVIMDTH